MRKPAAVATPAPSSGAVSATSSPEEQAERQRLLKLWVQVDAEYQTWRETHEDIIDYIQPGHGVFSALESNRGQRKDIKVINNTGTDRLTKLSGAIDVAVCSEARDWFSVSLSDAIAEESQDTLEYLHDYQEALNAFISKVGFYPPNRNAIDDVVGPSTGLVLIEEDDRKHARCTHVPLGQYRLAADSSGEVNFVARRFIYTASQMVQEFGADKVSRSVLAAMQQELTQTAKFQVLHIIEERSDRLPAKIYAENMPWSSTWMEMGVGFWGVNIMGQAQAPDALGPTGILRQSGYNEKPFYCFRWRTQGQDAYGKDSPGWKGLSDVKTLQDLEMSSATILALLQDPPLNVPHDLANASLLPRARNPMTGDGKTQAHPTMDVPHEAMAEARQEKRDFEARINQTMFGDVLFLLSADQHAEPRTAEEVRGKKEERLLQLGGVAARMMAELRTALFRFSAIAHRAGLMPPVPESLSRSNRKVKIDFDNPFINAQKAIGATAISQSISFALAVAQTVKGGADQVNADEACKTYNQILGVKPKILFSDEELAQRRSAQAAQANAAQQAAAMPQAAASIKDLSNSDPEKLRSLLSSFGPSAQAAGSTQAP